MISISLLDFLSCPYCYKELSEHENNLICNCCGRSFSFFNSIPDFYGLTDHSMEIISSKNEQDQNTWTLWRKMNYEFIRNHLQNIPSSAKILDVGAGPGHFKKLMKSNIYYATDFQPYSGIDFLTDLNKPLPVKSEYFDVVVMSNVLEHIMKPFFLLQEIHRILKKGGILLMVTPFIIKIHQAPYDYMRYTEYMFRQILTESGFNTYTIEKIGNIFNIYNLIFISIRKFIFKNKTLRRISRLILQILLIYIQLIFNLCKKIIGPVIVNQNDEIGYPQGYGCVAIKN